MGNDHFQGKSVVEHLKAAHTKGALALAETHGTELAGHLSAMADSAKETSVLFLFLWILLDALKVPTEKILLIFLLFTAGLCIWKIARSARIGWSRLERLHRLIEEERYEIEHHRSQERLELSEMYRAKGFSGKLLEEVVDVLMADDNRLLQVMLEEELGLSLEVQEHPLKQALGAGLGVLLSSLLLLMSFFLFSSLALCITSLLLIGVISLFAAKQENNNPLHAFIWNVSAASFAAALLYFLTHLFMNG